MLFCIYPKQINQLVYTQTAELAKQIEQQSPYSINDIQYNDVKTAIDELIPHNSLEPFPKTAAHLLSKTARLLPNLRSYWSRGIPS